MDEVPFELRRLIVGQDHLLECLLVASSRADTSARAQQAGVTVNTIGIGQRGQQTSLNRRTQVGLDETTLKSIASTTGGDYFYAAHASQLEQVYAHLGSQINWVQEHTEVTAIASGLGAAPLTIAGLLGLGWFGRQAVNRSSAEKPEADAYSG
jgi:hypothetical protein